MNVVTDETKSGASTVLLHDYKEEQKNGQSETGRISQKETKYHDAEQIVHLSSLRLLHQGQQV